MMLKWSRCVVACVYLCVLCVTVCGCASASAAAGGVAGASPEPAASVAIIGDKQIASGDAVQGCTIERFKLHSAVMDRDIEVAVVLPPAYATDATARFATLYALHGYGAPYDTFANMPTLRAEIGKHPMIVICFNGDKGGWYVDSPTDAKSQFETFYFNELVPFVDHHYRTLNDGGHRGVTGFSMGGYGAWHYMLVHPQMFASASGLSGAYEAAGSPNRKPGKWMQAMLGTYDEHADAYRKVDIYAGLKTAIDGGAPVPKLMIACGTEDRLVTESRALRDWLKARDIETEYLESPGGHDWAYWKGVAPQIIDFHARSFSH